MVCWDPTLSGSLFLYTGAAVEKSYLSMALLGKTEETDSLFPQVRLLDINKDEKKWKGGGDLWL